MELKVLDDAAALIEKANAALEPELVAGSEVGEVLARYTLIKKLASYGEAVMARRVDDAQAVARVAGTSIGHAKQTMETGKALKDAPEVDAALSSGSISLQQAGEIARAEQASPGCAGELLDTAQTESFQVLRDKARRIKLEAEQSRGLGERQREARAARSYADELGMVNIQLRLQPHIGSPIVNRSLLCQAAM